MSAPQIVPSAHPLEPITSAWRMVGAEARPCPVEEAVREAASGGGPVWIDID